MAIPLSEDQLRQAHGAGILTDKQFGLAMEQLGKDPKKPDDITSAQIADDTNAPKPIPQSSLTDDSQRFAAGLPTLKEVQLRMAKENVKRIQAGQKTIEEEGMARSGLGSKTIDEENVKRIQAGLPTIWEEQVARGTPKEAVYAKMWQQYRNKQRQTPAPGAGHVMANFALDQSDTDAGAAKQPYQVPNMASYAGVPNVSAALQAMAAPQTTNAAGSPPPPTGNLADQLMHLNANQTNLNPPTNITLGNPLPPIQGGSLLTPPKPVADDGGTDANVDLSDAGKDDTSSTSTDVKPSDMVSHPGDLTQSLAGDTPKPDALDATDNQHIVWGHVAQPAVTSNTAGSGGPKQLSPEQQLMADMTKTQKGREGAMSDEQAAIAERARLEGLRDSQKAAVINTYQDEAQRRQAEIEQDMAISHQQAQQQFRNLQAQIDEQSKAQIDPQAWWKSRGVGRSVLAALSMALGAMGSTMAGIHGKATPNFAMNIIQTAIEQNIDAQKDTLANKWRAIAAKSNTVDKQYIMEQGMIADKTKMIAQGWMNVQRQLDAIDAGSTSPIAAQKAKEVSAQIQQHLHDTEDIYAKHMYDVRTLMRQQANAGAGNNPAALYQKYVDEGHKARYAAAQSGNDPGAVEILDYPTWYKTRYAGTGLGGSTSGGTPGTPDASGIDATALSKIPKPLQSAAKIEIENLNKWQTARDSIAASAKGVKSVAGPVGGWTHGIIPDPYAVILRNIQGTGLYHDKMAQASYNTNFMNMEHTLNPGSGRTPEQQLAFDKTYLIQPGDTNDTIKKKVQLGQSMLGQPPSTPILKRFGVYTPPPAKQDDDTPIGTLKK